MEIVDLSGARLQRLAEIFDTPDKLDALERWTERELFRPKRIIVGVSGASGQQWPIEILKILRQIPFPGAESLVIFSEGSLEVMKYEMGYNPRNIDQIKSLATRVYNNRNMAADISSGSFGPIDGMVVVPCSVKTLHEIALGDDESLIARAAHVTLKEAGRRLILVPRETPFTLPYAKNIEASLLAGIHIFNPVPGFYDRPESIDALVTQTACRVLDQLGLGFDVNQIVKRWETPQS